MNKIIQPFIITLVAITTLLLPFSSYALPKEKYAESSVLAEGKWVRIPVSSTGMTLISESSLRAMGFSNPAEVNVYGTGGRMLPEYLNETMTDDLPLLPCVRTEKGIAFFATDVVSWRPTTSSAAPFTHQRNPYDTESWYYLSDRKPAGSKTMKTVEAPGAVSSFISVFTERLLHETEKVAPGESGRNLFGEDFRSTRTNSFPFILQGLAEGEAVTKISFAAKSSSPTSITVSANGRRLEATESDRIKATSSSEYCKLLTSIKSISEPEEKTDLQITYSPAGNVTFARLDYIEFFYPRQLRLDGAQLYFYTSTNKETAARIQGCSQSTRIWDITVPSDPVEMKFTLSGSDAFISLPEGYREFVAFDPSRLTASTIGWENVSNQDIHSLPTPDMVIITYDTYLDGAKKIAQLHEEIDGMKVEVLQPQNIYNEFSGGSAEVTAFRKLLKMWYDRGGERNIRYCLLMGRPHHDNRMLTEEARMIGYRPMPIWESKDIFTESGSYSTDCYIAMLDDCGEEFNMPSAKQRVAVGRIPVTNATQASEVAAKIERYVKEPGYGTWRNRMLLVADDIDTADLADVAPSETNPSTFFDQSEMVYKTLKSSEGGQNYIYDRLYLDAYPLEYTSIGLTYPAAKSKLISSINDGVVYTNYIGHANPRGWSHEKILDWDDINGFNNKNLTFLFGATCEFARWDGNAVSGGEIMMLNPTAGVIAMVMPSRTVYITQNYNLNKAMAAYLLKSTREGEPVRMGDFYMNGMNDLNDSNKLRYCFVGDPALTFPKPVNSVEFSLIAGTDITIPDSEPPVVEALGKVEVSGKILNPSGEIDRDFSGRIELILFDAEKPITTKDFGKGLDRVYNDRKTRLTSASLKVENGEWEGRLLIPAEIENNFSPAMISAYAWNERTGSEAHGVTEHLYVYGYDENAPIDNNVPTIEYFYLNSPAFTNGTVVNENPIVFASFYDESGINISDSGIGHKITLNLDGKKIYSDLNAYFTPDLEREGAGSLCYPLENLEPGKHTLTLTVFDNANNSSVAIIEFNVGAAVDPVITDLSTNVNPASTSVVFEVTVDRPNSRLNCALEVFDLSGRCVWSDTRDVTTDMQCVINTNWDLRDHNGLRVPRGIYIYRATVRTPEGTYSSKSRKLAVTAQ